MKVLILGAGVIGTTTAYFLARDGHEVTLVDRRPDVAQETSFANGGIIHISLVDPWNAPGVALKLLRWLGREDSPLLLRPGALPGMLGWGLAFLRNSTAARHRRHTLVNLRLALYSAKVLRQLRAETDLAYDHAEQGLTKLFRDPRELEHAVAFARLLEPHGVAHRVLDRAEILALEPALEAGGKGIVGAVLFPDDETGDARMFTRAVADLAEAAGAELRLGTSVEAIEAAGDRITGVRTGAGRLSADAYVLALGSYSPLLARPLGLRLPIYPVKGYSLTAPLDGWNAAPRLPIVDEALKVGLIPLGERLRIAGSAEFGGYDPTPQARRADYVWRNAVQVYPELARHVDRAAIQAWAGLRPMTADGPPILGATRFANLFLNTGHGHLGWTMACGSARAVADVVSGRSPEIDLDGLTAARFV